MKRITNTALGLVLFLFTAVSFANAQSSKAVDMFKNHINHMVQEVQKAPAPKAKREVLNHSFDNMLTAFNRVEKMKVLSPNDQTALNQLKENITEKKDELNGLNGYQRVEDSQLNNFALYSQQNIEQAGGTITIGVVTLLLIVIIIILLA